MSYASLEDITKFLSCKRVALVGVSRKAQHFSRALMNEFVTNGYDAVPVNPNASEIGGRKCFARISDITPPIEAALILTGTPDTTDCALSECTDASVRYVWAYKTTKSDETAVEKCRAHGSAIVENKCPFMFFSDPGLIHRLHGFISNVAGTYPA